MSFYSLTLGLRGEADALTKFHNWIKKETLDFDGLGEATIIEYLESNGEKDGGFDKLNEVKISRKEIEITEIHDIAVNDFQDLFAMMSKSYRDIDFFIYGEIDDDYNRGYSYRIFENGKEAVSETFEHERGDYSEFFKDTCGVWLSKYYAFWQKTKRGETFKKVIKDSESDDKLKKAAQQLETAGENFNFINKTAGLMENCLENSKIDLSAGIIEDYIDAKDLKELKMNHTAFIEKMFEVFKDFSKYDNSVLQIESIDLSGKKLDSIADLSFFKDLKELNLTETGIKKIPSKLEKKIKEGALQVIGLDGKKQDVSEKWINTIKKDAAKISQVPKELLTEEMCLLAVRQSGYTLQYVPEAMRTKEICLEAIKRSGSAMKHVPSALMSEEFCFEAVSQSKDTLDTLELLPAAMKSDRLEKLCLELVKEYGDNLSYVPPALKTEAVCLEAVRQRCFAIEHVPESMMTEKICLEAVKQKSSSPMLEYIPESKRTEKVCLEAVKKDGGNLEFVPSAVMTEKICLEAVKSDTWIVPLQFVPPSLKTEEICLEAVRKNDDSFQYIPSDMKSAKLEKLCLEKVKLDGFALQYIPERFKTKELCLEAVKQKGRSLENVPENLKTEEICIEAVKQDSSAFKFLPSGLKSAKLSDLCLEKIRQDGALLFNVPEFMKTPELCLEAVKQQGWTLCYVPESLRTEELCTLAVQLTKKNNTSKDVKDTLEEVPKKIREKVKKSLGI